jgi:hypothetical protein
MTGTLPVVKCRGTTDFIAKPSHLVGAWYFPIKTQPCRSRSLTRPPLWFDELAAEPRLEFLSVLTHSEAKHNVVPIIPPERMAARAKAEIQAKHVFGHVLIASA